MTVAFRPGAAGPRGKRVRLPNPARDLPAGGGRAAARRGRRAGAAAALSRRRGACEARCPAARWREAIFEALEQARVEALGARRMVGVGANLRARARRALPPPRVRAGHRTHRRHARRGGAAARARGADRRAAAARGAQGRRAWRPWLEGKIAEDLAELDKLILDQDAYARATRRLIQDLDLDLGEMDGFATDDQQSQGDEADGENQTDSGESATAGAQPSMDGAPADGAAEDAEQDGDADADGEMMPGSSDDDPGRPGRPGQMPRGRADENAAYKRLHTRCRTRSSRPTSCAMPTSWAGCATCSTSSCRICRASSPGSPTGCSAACWRRQTRAWEFDLDEGILDAARLARVVTNPVLPLSFKREQRNRFPRHRRDLADRQFRLDARPADHGRGDERRHPRPHAGALRASRSRSSASPRAPGRAARRASAGSPPASRPTPAGSTICATSSTNPPMRRGGGRGAASG